MLTNTINSELLATVNTIKSLAEAKLESKKIINELTRIFSNLKIEQSKIKTAYEKQIIANPDYKNEKTRIFALEEKLASDHEYCMNEINLNQLNLDIEVKNFELDEIRIELEYQRNILKIAEIELREVA